jgi:hypothetical protein
MIGSDPRPVIASMLRKYGLGPDDAIIAPASAPDR